jgi:superfamily I DNA and/or RNA helicase
MKREDLIGNVYNEKKDECDKVYNEIEKQIQKDFDSGNSCAFVKINGSGDIVNWAKVKLEEDGYRVELHNMQLKEYKVWW